MTRPAMDYERWLLPEDNYIRRHYSQGVPAKEVAIKLKRSPRAVHMRALKLGLRRVRKVKWTLWEDTLITDRYRNTSSAALARSMGTHTPLAVRCRAYAKGIRKSR